MTVFWWALFAESALSFLWWTWTLIRHAYRGEDPRRSWTPVWIAFEFTTMIFILMVGLQ